MNEDEWLAGPDLIWMLHYLEQTDRHRKDEYSRRLRLFACACCRRVWELLRWNVAMRCVELAEAYAEGEATREKLLVAHGSAEFNGLAAQERGLAEGGSQLSRRTLDAIGAARFLTSDYYFKTSGATIVAQDTSKDPTADYFPTPKDMGSAGVPPDAAEMAKQQELLKDIFGNPFRPRFVGEWLNSSVLAIASGVYQERALPSGHLDTDRLAVLSDALEEAGCSDSDILEHLRSPGPHVRGCWALDLILGKS